MNKNIIIGIIVIVVLVIIGVSVASTSPTTPSDNQNATTTIENDLTGMDNEMMNATSSESAQPLVSASTTVNVSTGSVKTFTVDGSNFKFVPNQIKVKKGDTVKIIFKNTGGFHDLKIDEFNVGTKQLQDGAQETVQFVADKAGTFEYYCSVGQHRQMGMKGTLIVE